MACVSCEVDTSFETQGTTPYALPDTNLGPKLLEPEGELLLTNEGVAFGKQLFFDKNLSSNKEVSCATCHFPELAFTHKISLANNGVSGNTLARHSPALFNLMWQDAFFWDGGAKNLEAQVLGPLTHSDEMNAELTEVLDYIIASEHYTKLYQAAFPKEDIKVKNIMQAIAQFEKTLISSNSWYDQSLTGQYVLTSNEKNGQLLFETNCASCHAAPLFQDQSYHNNGLDASFDYDFEDERLGRNRITNNPDDLGKYKTPSLRNIEVSAPYMHDGRFATLEDVLNHYSEGLTEGPSLDKSLPIANNGFQFSNKEKSDIIAFLKTLTDPTFLNNPNHRIN